MALKPNPDGDRRHSRANQRRNTVTGIAFNRQPQATSNNGEIDHYGAKPTNYHKGIPHDAHGIPDPDAFADFVTAINRDNKFDGQYARFDVALGPLSTTTPEVRPTGSNPGRRKGGFAAVTEYHSVLENASATQIETRNWESPLGGHAYVVEGPDPGDLAMAPAPKVKGDEICAEMAEVYALALLRDMSFHDLEDPSKPVIRYLDVDAAADGNSVVLQPDAQSFTVGDVVDELNGLTWFDTAQEIDPSDGTSPSPQEERRRTARFKDGAVKLSTADMFRGSVPGAKDGPYLSQFLLIGNGTTGEAGAESGKLAANSSVNRTKQVRNIPEGAAPVGYSVEKAARTAAESGTLGSDTPPDSDKVADGYIVYGVQRIDQRVIAHLPGLDYMTDWTLWLDVQNGADVRKADSYFPDERPRFISTPRDLATYVHFDQLYQAYLNACLLLFSYEMPFDHGFPSGSGHTTRGSFATFGGPHLLSLLTEVASRGLRAVRRQKFQHHLRGRPEQLAAMLTLAASDESDALGNAEADMKAMLAKMTGGMPRLMEWIDQHNTWQNQKRIDSHAPGADTAKRIYPHRPGAPVFTPSDKANYLLPMAFPEGSPMHPAYGAGHATVAGACTTVLKAFFEMSDRQPTGGLEQPLTPQDAKSEALWWNPARMSDLGLTRLYRAPADRNGTRLEYAAGLASDLTVEGEINKLAANIAIGRNMAGVHYYTDYYDSLRMGERVAVGILQEQMVTYPEPVSMRLNTFDGDKMVIWGDGEGGAFVEIQGGFGWENAYDEWWDRHAGDSSGGGRHAREAVA